MSLPSKCGMTCQCFCILKAQILRGKHYGLGRDYGAEESLIVIPGNLNEQHYVNEVLDTEAIPFLQRQL